MQPTVSPGRWSGVWRGWSERERGRERVRERERARVRVSLRDLADMHVLQWAGLQRSDRPTLYSPKQIRHLIRLEGSAESARQGLSFPTLPPAWFREKLPPDPQLRWRFPELTRLEFQESQPSSKPPAIEVDVSPPHPGLAASVAARWELAMRSWAAGSALLALLVLIVRVADKCVDGRLLNLRRRRSREWPTPNVLATSHLQSIDSDMRIPRLDDSEEYPSEVTMDSLGNDLPPPYSECANAGNNKSIKTDEPPPPYSACYVALSNSKDVPAVQFYNTQRQQLSAETLTEAGHSSGTSCATAYTSNNCNNVTPDIDSSRSGTNDDDNKELVFNNGRIIERAIIENTDLNSGNVQASMNTSNTVMKITSDTEEGRNRNDSRDENRSSEDSSNIADNTHSNKVIVV